MMVKNDRKKEEEVIVEVEQKKSEEDLFMDSKIIKVVRLCKYLRSEEESKGTMVAEVYKRIVTRYAAYNKFDKVTFSDKHFRLKKKLEVFVCIVIPV
jgi:hypothetical protein